MLRDSLWPWREFPLASEALRTDLRERLRSLVPEIADGLSRPSSEVALLDLPFLRGAKVYKLLLRSPVHAVRVYVGLTAGGGTIVLDPDLGAFIRLAQGGQVAILNEGTAIAYAQAALEIGRNQDELFYGVTNVDDLWFRDPLSPEDESTRNAIRLSYGDRIRPPHAQRMEYGFLVEAYYARQGTLELHRTFVTASGGLDDQVEICERDLPLVVGQSHAFPRERPADAPLGGPDVA